MAWYNATQNTAITGLFLSAIAVLVRLRVKWLSVSNLTADDFTMVLAWMFSFITETTILYGLDHGGLGRHLPELSLLTIRAFEKVLAFHSRTAFLVYILVAACAFVVTLTLTRLSHILLLRRLFSAVSPATVLMARVWVAGGLLTVGCIILLGCLVFACRPVSKSWDPSVAGTCLNRAATYIAIAVFNVVSDLVLTMLTIWVVLPFRLSASQKSHVLAMMLVGSVTMIISAIRLKVTVPLLHAEDITYVMAPVGWFVALEANLAIIVACVPALRRGMQLLTVGSRAPATV